MAMVDVAFGLQGEHIPEDHGYALFLALSEHLDWLADEEDAAVHPIRGAHDGNGGILLTGRSRLVLRLTGERAAQSLTIAGTRLDVGGALEVGAGRMRPLLAHGTLYSPLVATGEADEGRFVAGVSAALAQAGIDGPLVCGRPRVLCMGEHRLAGYSLMVQGLTPAESLRLQQSGLGLGRKMGCGIFVPHRSAAAVGH